MHLHYYQYLPPTLGYRVYILKLLFLLLEQKLLRTRKVEHSTLWAYFVYPHPYMNMLLTKGFGHPMGQFCESSLLPIQGVVQMSEYVAYKRICSKASCAIISIERFLIISYNSVLIKHVFQERCGL